QVEDALRGRRGEQPLNRMIFIRPRLGPIDRERSLVIPRPERGRLRQLEDGGVARDAFEITRLRFTARVARRQRRLSQLWEGLPWRITITARQQPTESARPANAAQEKRCQHDVRELPKRRRRGVVARRCNRSDI